MAKPIQQNKKLKKLIICVEGNIGSGKTTLLSNLKKLGYTVIPEPIDTIWQKFLPLFYNNKKKWAFCFQMEVLHWFYELKTKNIDTFLKTPISKKNITENVLIIERSPLSVMQIFTKNLLKTKKISEWEFSLIKRFYNIIYWKPNHIIYLKCNTHTILQRIIKRNRKGENLINNVLLENLNENHEILFNNTKNKLNVTIINSNDNKNTVLNITTKCIFEIMNNSK